MRLNKQNKVIVITLAFLLTIMVGYALFSESININSTAKASGELNIIFSKVGTPIGRESSIVPKPQITNNGKTLNIKGVKLNMPTSYLEVPAVIENTGSIDAKVKDIDITGLDDPDIEVSYSGVHQDQILKPKDTAPITIKIEWKKESTVTAKNLSFSIDINYEQITKEVIMSEPKVEYHVGDTIKLADEEFIVIEDSLADKTTVTALSKYNLLVGQIYDSSNLSYKPITASIVGYGLQNEEARGYVESQNIRTGVIKFSDTNYWYDSVLRKLKREYGTSYPTIVFDENSKLYTHIKNYENYLRKKIGYDSVRTSLITYEQLVNLGCSAENSECFSNASLWVYSTSYWGASARFNKNVVVVDSLGNFGSNNYVYEEGFGLRPVITISKSEL